MRELSYSWEPSPHTADLAIAIEASDEVGLFRAALDGLLGSAEIEAGPSKGSRFVEYHLHIAFRDLESALVDFLNECIYLMEVEELVAFDFHAIKVGEDSLDAVLLCREVSEHEKPEIGHIKAATYSDLQVTMVDGKYRARLVFDT